MMAYKWLCHVLYMIYSISRPASLSHIKNWCTTSHNIQHLGPSQDLESPHAFTWRTKKNMKDTLILFGKTPHQLLMSYEDKSYSSRIPFSIFIVINIPSIHIMIDPEFNTLLSFWPWYESTLSLCCVMGRDSLQGMFKKEREVLLHEYT